MPANHVNHVHEVAGSAVWLNPLVSHVNSVPLTPVNLIHSFCVHDWKNSLPAVMVGAVSTKSCQVGVSFFASFVSHHVS